MDKLTLIAEAARNPRRATFFQYGDNSPGFYECATCALRFIDHAHEDGDDAAFTAAHTHWFNIPTGESKKCSYCGLWMT